MLNDLIILEFQNDDPEDQVYLSGNEIGEISEQLEIMLQAVLDHLMPEGQTVSLVVERADRGSFRVFFRAVYRWSGDGERLKRHQAVALAADMLTVLGAATTALIWVGVELGLLQPVSPNNSAYERPPTTEIESMTYEPAITSAFYGLRDVAIVASDSVAVIVPDAPACRLTTGEIEERIGGRARIPDDFIFGQPTEIALSLGGDFKAIVANVETRLYVGTARLEGVRQTPIVLVQFAAGECPNRKTQRRRAKSGVLHATGILYRFSPGLIRSIGSTPREAREAVGLFLIEEFTG